MLERPFSSPPFRLGQQRLSPDEHPFPLLAARRDDGFKVRHQLTQRLKLSPLAAGKIARKHRHQQKKHKRQNVFLTRDDERERRWYEQEIVKNKRQPRTRQGRPQTAAHGNHQHGREEYQRNVR